MRKRITSLLLILILLCNTNQAYAEASDKVEKLFEPTDIFMFGVPDWENFEVAQRIDGDVFGAPSSPVFFLYLDDDREAIYRRMVDNAHKNNMKFFAHLTFDPILQLFDSGLGAAGRDIDGNILRLIFFGIDSKPIYSFLNPETKEKMLIYLKQCVDIGVDGFCNDNCDFTLTFILAGNGDFSDTSIAGFRKYLAGEYSVKELKNMGINDVTSFDYKEFIRTNYYDEYINYKNADRLIRIPLFKDFFYFQLKAANQFWTEVIAETKAYARSIGRNIIFSANISENCSEGKTTQVIPYLPAAQTADLFMAEYNYGYPPSNLELVNYKLYNSFGKQVSMVTTDIRTAEWYARDDYENLIKLYIAEAYSTGNYFNIPYTQYALNPDKTDFTYYSMEDISDIYPYCDFIKNNPDFYEKLNSTADIALYYSTATIKQETRLGYNESDGTQGFYGTALLLNDLHYQYDIISAGDNVLFEDKYSKKELSAYKMIILPDVSEMTDRQVTDTLGYVKKGGTLIASGDIGVNNEKGKPVSRKVFHALLKEGINPYGKGTIVYLKSNIGMEYIRDPSAQINPIFTYALTRKINDIATDANKKVSVIKYENSENSSLVLHLINYNYSTIMGENITQNNFNMSLKLNDNLAGKNINIKYASPDLSEAYQLDFTQEGSTINFCVPKLCTYGVVKISSKSDVGALHTEILQ